jgi:hypothetical protein
MTVAITNLKVPFSEKDQAKALGAKWNAELKQWYVPQGLDAKPFEKWFSHSTDIPKSIIKTVNQTSTDSQSFDDDMDAINAKLRDAYEFREPEEL